MSTTINLADHSTATGSMDWKTLQNGSDIRGVAMEGVLGEAVNLTPAIAPNNYEGVRVSCQSPQQDGWFLLRLSLHDSVIPLNIESNVPGGVALIAGRLLEFFRSFDALDLTVF